MKTLKPLDIGSRKVLSSEEALRELEEYQPEENCGQPPRQEKPSLRGVEGLVYALGNTGGLNLPGVKKKPKNAIYFLNPKGESIEDDILITARYRSIGDLAVFNGCLYVAGLDRKVSGEIFDMNKKVYEVVNGHGEIVDREIVTREGVILSLAVFNGCLYDGGQDGIFQIFNDKGRLVNTAKIGRKQLHFFPDSLVEFNDSLYMGSSKGVYQLIDSGGNFVKRKLTKRSDVVHALAVFNNCLYDAGYYKKVYQTLNSGGEVVNKKIVAREWPVLSLVVFNGCLYDGGWYGIFQATDKHGNSVNKPSLRRDLPGAVIALAAVPWKLTRTYNKAQS
jgi:hypothetical protein